MGGKTSKSTQTVSIPPEVLARYNAVNARAEQAAGTPFQPYSYNPADFAAQLTPTQLAGIQNVNYAAGQAQPYYDEATNQLMGGQMAAVPYYAQAEANIGAGQGYGMQGLQGAQYNLMGAQDIGAQLAQQAYLQQAQAGQAAQPLQQYAQGIYGQAFQAAQPYNVAALQQYYGGLGAAAPISQAALANLSAGQQAGQDITSMALQQLGAGQAQAMPVQQAALEAVGLAPFAAAPMTQAAAANVAAAQAGAQPYQQLATQFGLAGGRPVSPGALTGQEIGQYMSPYIQSVVAPTAALLRQQAEQAQAGQLGNAIRAGAFGGDRAAIAAANLQQQQTLAQSKALSDLMQAGYGQALATAQQQQQLGLTAEQANRAAQQATAAQLLGVGQTGFGQGLGAAQQQAALAQQIYGQQLGAGQAQAALAQQLFGQGATAAQQQQAAAQALFGQSAQAAQQQAALAQQLFGQQAAAGQNIAGLGQQTFQQGLASGQAQAALAQQLFGQGMSQAQQQAALSQLLFGQGTGIAQQQAALGQQGFQQQLAAAEAQRALGQGLYGMGAGTAQQLAGLGAGAQGAALQGAQAQLAAGQAQQQTAQAGLQALYNQFLQQQAYPFQVAQFLGNIAMGTGALSGSTTSTVTPGSLFSDIRTKENVRDVGKTFDGQPIYSFNYKGDPKTQMGLIAQEVEQRHPEAVGLAGGLKTVDYEKATRNAARRGEIIDAEFEPIREGGAVLPHRAGLGFADGGAPMADDAQRKAEEDARRKQAERAAEMAVQSARDTAKPDGIPKVDLKPDMSAPAPTSAVPSAIGIPSETRPTPQLAVASGPPPADPRSQDAQTLVQMAALAMAMSDRRMKEDIKHIGFTHDGQKIYSYRIKGDPHTQIGLMADEVEKHTPDAVGSINGLKTVDYDRATEVAAHAKRGKFADGGSPGLASPSDMAALLAAQAQMFGPFSEYGRATTGLPGAGGYIPAANLPVGQLITAPGLPAQSSSLEDLRNLAGLGQDIRTLTTKRPPATTPPAGSTTTTTTPGSVAEPDATEELEKGFATASYRGGLRMADGGTAVLPYQSSTALNIPVSMNIPQLLKAGELPKQRTTLEDVRDIAATAASIAGLTGNDPSKASQNSQGKAFAHGGYTGGLARSGYEDGGTPSQVTDPELLRRIAEAGEAQIAAAARPRPAAGLSGAQRPDARPTVAPPTATAPPAPLPADVATARLRSAAALSGGQRPDARPTITPPTAAAPSAAPAADVTAAPPAGGLAGTTPATAPAFPTPPAAAPSVGQTGLAPPAAPAPATATPPAAPGFGQRTRTWLQENKDLLFPLLTGAATAAAAPTRNFGTALLLGAGAAGKSYQDVLQRQAELEQSRATTGQIQATTAQTQAATLAQRAEVADLIRRNQVIKEADGREFVLLGDGSRMLLGRWLMLSPSQRSQIPLIGQKEMAGLMTGQMPETAAAPPAQGAAPEAPSMPEETPAQRAEKLMSSAPLGGDTKYLGENGRQQISNDIKTNSVLNQTSRNALAERNQTLLKGIDAGANSAYGNGAQISQIANYVSKIPDGGVAAPGVLADIRRQLVRGYNDIIGTIAGTFGGNPNQYQVSESELTAGTALDKISAGLQFALASGADQNSLGALQSAANAIPSTKMSKEEGQALVATMLIDKQRALDLANYIREAQEYASQSGMPEALSVANAMASFRSSPLFNDRAYNERKNAVLKLLQKTNPQGITMWEYMRKRGMTPEQVDQAASDFLYGVTRDPNTGRITARKPPIKGVSNILYNQ